MLRSSSLLIAAVVMACQPAIPPAPVIVETPPDDEVAAEELAAEEPASDAPVPTAELVGAGLVEVGGIPFGTGTIGRIDGPTETEHGRLGRAKAADPDASQGSLPPEIVHRMVAPQRAEIGKCYQAELQKTPDLSGRLVVRFVIDGAGKVTSVQIDESLHSDVDSCVAAVFQAITFPKPKGGTVTVRYPLVFSAQP
jgi:TonB family protein